MSEAKKPRKENTVEVQKQLPAKLPDELPTWVTCNQYVSTADALKAIKRVGEDGARYRIVTVHFEETCKHTPITKVSFA